MILIRDLGNLQILKNSKIHIPSIKNYNQKFSRYLCIIVEPSKKETNFLISFAKFLAPKIEKLEIFEILGRLTKKFEQRVLKTCPKNCIQIDHFVGGKRIIQRLFTCPYALEFMVEK